jgi:hypothetical protein
MSCETNGCQRASMARREHDNDAAAFTSRARGGAGLEVGLHRVLGAREVDRQNEILHFGRAHQHRVGQHDEIAPDLFDEPGNDDAVEHAVGVVGDDNDGARLGDRGERGGVELHVQLQLADGGGEKALATARMALVLQIHSFQLGLSGGDLDKPDQAALDGRIERARIAEQIFVHVGVI